MNIWEGGEEAGERRKIANSSDIFYMYMYMYIHTHYTQMAQTQIEREEEESLVCEPVTMTRLASLLLSLSRNVPENVWKECWDRLDETQRTVIQRTVSTATN